MKLKIADRYSILRVLPFRDTNYDTLLIAKGVRENVELTKEEKKEYKVVDFPDGRVQWDLKFDDEEKDFELSEPEANLIKTELKKKNDENKLDSSLFEIYVLFVANSK